MARKILHVLEDMGLTIKQPENGYRFSVDSLLLADFCRLRRQDCVLDLGTGSGVIALVLAKKYPEISVTALEIQKRLVEFALLNARQNGLERQIKVIHGDLNNIDRVLMAQSMDHVVANPPYRPPVSGRICINSMEALARHEILTDIERVTQAARYVLRPMGRFSVIFPAERVAGLVTTLTANRMEPKRMQMVHPDERSKARMCMIEACRDAGRELHILPPIFLNSPDT